MRLHFNFLYELPFAKQGLSFEISSVKLVTCLPRGVTLIMRKGAGPCCRLEV